MQTRSVFLIGGGILLASFLSAVAVFYFGLMVNPSNLPQTALEHVSAVLLAGGKSVLVALPPTTILCSITYMVSKRRVDLDPVVWGASSGVLVSLVAWLAYFIMNARNVAVTADQIITNGLLVLIFGFVGGFIGGKAAHES